MDTQSIIAALEAERERLDQAIAALQGSKRRGTRPLVRVVPSIMRKGRRLSAAARKRISDAQKKRWAERKKKAA